MCFRHFLGVPEPPGLWGSVRGGRRVVGSVLAVGDSRSIRHLPNGSNVWTLVRHEMISRTAFQVRSRSGQARTFGPFIRPGVLGSLWSRVGLSGIARVSGLCGQIIQLDEVGF
jgi:hypothetical protein